jgi:hypothetical protein
MLQHQRHSKEENRKYALKGFSRRVKGRYFILMATKGLFSGTELVFFSETTVIGFEIL